MNRIEIVGLFTALKELCKKKELESIEHIVDAVLNEAKWAKDKNDAPETRKKNIEE